jgi:hypothetical protein
MTPRLQPFAVAPEPMRAWRDFGQALLRSGLEHNLMELVESERRKSTVVPVVSTCTLNMAKRRSVSTSSRPGASHPSTVSANVRRLPGPKP